jgi:hypothetical protein
MWNLFRWLPALVLLLPTVTLAGSIQLQGNEPVRWKKTSISYYVNQDGSDNISNGSDISAVHAGWDAWEAMPCGFLTFEDKGLINDKKITVVGYGTNGKNEIAFIENNQWTYGSFVLGLTSTSMFSGGSIIEADIGFNGLHHTWSTTGQPNTVDVLAVATHEQGHAVGLQHALSWPTSSTPPIMSPSTDGTSGNNTPTDNDKVGFCFLYPNNYVCTSDDDCPMVVEKGPEGEYYSGQITCQEGQCGGFSNQVPVGTKQLGEECATDYDCVDEQAFCQAMSGSGGYCAVQCDDPANNDCPEPLVCMGYQNSSKGVCLPASGSGNGGDGQVGDLCQGGQECESLLCVSSPGSNGGICQQGCTPGNDTTCPSGQTCSPLSGSAIGVCIDGAASGSKATGETCANPTECISGLCVGSGSGYICMDSCAPGVGSCSEGFSCVSLSSGGGACVPSGGGQLGDECQYNNDCQSDACISINNPEFPAPFCSQDCSSAECPCGFNCSNFQGGASYCTPGEKLGCIPNENPCASDIECISSLCHAGICKDLTAPLPCATPEDCWNSTGMCYAGLCETPCVTISPDCPPGLGCQRLTTNEINGICVAPGPDQAGSPCTADAACSTLFCEGKGSEPKTCLIACDPNEGANCGDALECVPMKAGVGACVLVEEVPAPTTETGGEVPNTGETGGETGGEAGGETGVNPNPETGEDTGDGFGEGTTAGGGRNPPGFPQPDPGNGESGGCQTTSAPPSMLLPALMALLAGCLCRRRREALTPQS